MEPRQDDGHEAHRGPEAGRGGRHGEGAGAWKQQSLSLNQNQPDAIGLLKELGGDVTTWSSRSLMEDIINNEVKTELKTSKFEYDPNHWPTPENHNGSHGVNHILLIRASRFRLRPTRRTTGQRDLHAGHAPSSQPTTEPAVDCAHHHGWH